MLLKDKVAVVHGGGGAIGGASARTFAREGARVFLAGRTRTKLELVASAIIDAGGVAEVATLDLLDEAAVRAHADHVAASAGGIDIAMNAVGFPHVQGTPFARLTLAEFTHPIATYTRAHFIAAQAVAPHMRRRGGGVMLTLTAPGPRLTGKGFLGHGVAGAAVETFSRILAGELGADGIRVVCIRSDAIRDAVATSFTRDVFAPMAAAAGLSVDEWLAGRARGATLLGRLPKLEEVAEFAAFAASDRAGSMTAAIANLTSGSIIDF